VGTRRSPLRPRQPTIVVPQTQNSPETVEEQGEQTVNDDGSAVSGGISWLAQANSSATTAADADAVGNDRSGVQNDVAATLAAVQSVVDEGPGVETCGDAEDVGGDAEDVAGDAESVEGEMVL